MFEIFQRNLGQKWHHTEVSVKNKNVKDLDLNCVKGTNFCYFPLSFRGRHENRGYSELYLHVFLQTFFFTRSRKRWRFWPKKKA